MASSRHWTRGVRLMVLAAAVQLVGAPASFAATGIPATAIEPPVEQLQELSEIRVVGKRVARDVTAAEDAFFKLYNELNTDDLFDVHCGYASLNPHSMIMVRTCMPGYLADAHGRNNSMGIIDPVRCFNRSTQSGAYSNEGWSNSAIVAFLPGVSCGSPGAPTAQVAHSAHQQHRAEYARTVATVVQSDPRLQEMVAELAVLYDQMETVQRHYTDRRDADPSAARDVRFVHAGPRPR